MAVLKNKDGTELAVDCHCGCDQGLRIKIEKEDPDYYFFMTYTNGKYYEDQESTLLGVLSKKIKKIWAIITNKDFYYSDIVMSKKDFSELREYINSI